jgi:hypothetical protein
VAKKILIAVALLIVGLIGGLFLVISLQPSTFGVERSATMAAAPDVVFARVNDFKAWDDWSPWSKLDPNAKTTFSTPSAGNGATFAWAGNDKVGEGNMTIVDIKPDELVEVEQVFVKPYAGKCQLAFTLVPAEDGTKVTWKMDGKNDFFGKAFCLFMDMDTMLGTPFEQGLANMKALVEKTGAAPAAP